MPTDSFSLALPGENPSNHNIYKPGFGYLTDHIPENQQRGHSAHWNEQYNKSSSFEESWKPRSGPLEFIYHLTQRSPLPILILNMGAGLGDFTTDLARIPNTFVHHVDFSQQGNNVAQEKINGAGVQTKTQVHTGDNNAYLKQFAENDNQADVVFLYGASGSNEPSDIEYQKTKEETQERHDFHPLVPGRAPAHHTHLAYRCLFVKPSSENIIPSTIDFDFKNALNPEWEHIWKNL